MRVEAWLTRAARQRPRSIAIETREVELTYADLDRRAGIGARQLGLAPGTRAAIALPPGADFAVALHACLRAGVVAIPLDPRDPGAAAAADVVIDAPLATRGPSLAGDFHELDATVLVVRTSGTSGEPKEVPLTYGNFLWSAIGSAVALGLDPRERWLCTLPLVHVGGLSIVLRSAIYATTAIVHERFETAAALSAVMSGGATLVSVVATTLTRLLDAGLERPPRLRCALAGGGPVPPALIERAHAAGVAVSQTYGLTEACSQVATQVPGDGHPDAGPPLFCTRVGLAADGEILVSGPTVSPAVAGGVLATGDLGECTAEGSLRVVGRKSETIISGGENVAPSEVEGVLEAHPAVLEAAVYGRADPAWGETVHALVVVRGQVRAEELRAHCAARLAPYKVPKRIAFVASLPRTASGSSSVAAYRLTATRRGHRLARVRYRLLVILAIAVAIAVPALAQASGRRVVGNCRSSQTRPTSIIVACADANLLLTHLHWSSFGGASARASGDYYVNDCTPYCAAGKFHAYPITVVLSGARVCSKDHHDDYRIAAVTFTGARPKGAQTKIVLGCPLAG